MAVSNDITVNISIGDNIVIPAAVRVAVLAIRVSFCVVIEINI